jgi:DNA-binding transcriptional ArsR family regulator
MAYDKALHAIADPTRREVFERLRKGPLPVGRLASGLPVSRPAVSQHLRVLQEAGLVRVRREGTRRVYSVDFRGLSELRRYLEGFWGDVLEAFRSVGPGARRARHRAARRPRGKRG